MGGMRGCRARDGRLDAIPLRASANDSERTLVYDRVRIAVGVLQALGLKATPEQVLKGAGLDDHNQRRELAGWVQTIMEGLQ